MKRGSVIICCLFCFVLLVGSVCLLAAPSAKVERVVFATSIENREPVGEAAEFDQSVGRVYCWTKLTAENPPVGFTHVWYKGDQKVLEVPLKATFPSTRTWSNKGISPGNWKVDVVDESGQVISSATFTVR